VRRRSKRREKRGVYLLPNLLTAASLLCGFYALVASWKGEFVHAAVAILLAGLFDGIDGKVARLTHSASRFGTEFDSLADLVSFGVAPAMLAYSWILHPYGRWGWLAAFLYVICGALRLARFNVRATAAEMRHFSGLPTPAAAYGIATTVLLSQRLGIPIEEKGLFLSILLYLLAFLMVSNFPYPSFKDLELLRRRPFSTLVTGILIMVVVIAEPQITLFLCSWAYVTLGPLKRVRIMRQEKLVKERELG